MGWNDNQQGCCRTHLFVNIRALSITKQSTIRMDCFVASLLAKTDGVLQQPLRLKSIRMCSW